MKEPTESTGWGEYSHQMLQFDLIRTLGEANAAAQYMRAKADVAEKFAANISKLITKD